MSEKTLAGMKWNEIPDSTPVYKLLEAVGFPEPMVILKHMNKTGKNDKKNDLSSIVTFLWKTKGDIHHFIKDAYETLSESAEVKQYLLNHPEQALLLANSYKQLNEEPFSVIAQRSVSEWRKLAIEDGTWQNLMTQTPLSILEYISTFISSTDYLHTPIGDLWKQLGIETKFEKVSIKSVGDKFVEAEENEQMMKKLKEELSAAGLNNLVALLNMDPSDSKKFSSFGGIHKKPTGFGFPF